MLNSLLNEKEIKYEERLRLPSKEQYKPDISNLVVFGARAYVRKHNVPRLRKVAPRALIGYLVGYVASNIWRIWIPRPNKVIMARDCIFDERRKFDPRDPFVSEVLYESETSDKNQEYIYVRSEEAEPNYDSIDRLSDQDVIGWLDENGGAHVEDVPAEPEVEPENPENQQHEDLVLGDTPPTPPEPEELEEIKNDDPSTDVEEENNHESELKEQEQMDEGDNDTGMEVLEDEPDEQLQSGIQENSPDYSIDEDAWNADVARQKQQSFQDNTCNRTLLFTGRAFWVADGFLC